jgi:hypothetical protein
MKSTIEWTEDTWNPVTGCTKISTGCDHCYAEGIAERFRGSKAFPNGFDLTLKPERLSSPLGWKKPRMIFVNSMSDLFHKDIPSSYIESVFETMEQADWHTFQVLTKRSSLMRDFINARYSPRPVPPHIWLGVSVEHRVVTRNAGRRIPRGSQADRPPGHIVSVIARHLHSQPSLPGGGNPGIRLGVHPREAPAMKSYRLLLLDSKGRLLGSRAVECMTDGEAVARAERENSTFALIEIWRGGDLIGTFTNPRAGEHLD